ncbi:hypothetical protein M885DRAFT_573286, partial [Pelagophyceae sp. CCMP2097]
GALELADLDAAAAALRPTADLAQFQVDRGTPPRQVDSAAGDDVSAHGHAANEAPKGAKKTQKAAPPAGDDASAHGHAANEAPKGAKKVQKSAPDKTRTVTADRPKKGAGCTDPD